MALWPNFGLIIGDQSGSSARFLHLIFTWYGTPLGARLQTMQPDVMAWRNGAHKEFNRHEFWQHIRKKGPQNKGNMLIWKGRGLPRANWVVYLGASGRLPTDGFVQKQGRSLASRCQICKRERDDINHLFFSCKGARCIWSSISGKFGRANPWQRCPQNLMQGLIRWHKKGFKEKILDKCWKDSFHMTIWFIWKTRNHFKHKGDIPISNLPIQFWRYCSEYWWNIYWKGAHLNKLRNWLRSGVLWSDGVRYDDRWVEISVASWLKDGRKGVAGLIRDADGGFRFGLACWFNNN
ncbi:hypothetical protein EJ110_NYTH13731 [Nymphaea thermarum]|nr:hypothetical protein EJ110_NYTH13731 [Nymphaea thermarum]